MAQLTGTEKQIKWASEIRATLILAANHWKAILAEHVAPEADKAPVYASIAGTIAKIESQTSAAWFCNIGSEYKIGAALDFNAATNVFRAMSKGRIA